MTDQLQTERTIGKGMSRAKQAARGVGRAPSDLKFESLPDQYSVTKRAAPFLLKDSGPGEERFLIFATAEHLDLMCRYREWSGDGASCAKQFYQLYTLHVILQPSEEGIDRRTFSKRTTIVPTVCVLMSKKTKKMYRAVLDALCVEKPDLSPSHVMTDFELAVHLALEEIWPNAKLSFCLFHLGQSVWKKVQELGLAKKEIRVSSFKAGKDVSRPTETQYISQNLKLENIVSEYDPKDALGYLKRVAPNVNVKSSFKNHDDEEDN